MSVVAQQSFSKRSSRVARDFLARLTRDAPTLLREVANLREDGITRFKKLSPFFERYNGQELLLLRDELRALWTRDMAMSVTVRIAWKEYSERLKADREREPEKFGTATLQEFICNRWLDRAHGGIVVVWEGRKREIQPDPYELPALLAYCSLLNGDRLRVCRNRDCLAPYFVVSRRDQRYCSAECAAPFKRAAKRRSWHKHKQTWPSQRKRPKYRDSHKSKGRKRGRKGKQ